MFGSLNGSSHPVYRRRQHRGGILISALVFSVIIAFLLAGMGTFTVSHLSRESTESAYTSALDLAEAGVNYELRKVSVNASNADQYNATTQNGVTYTLGNGTFTVYCENQDGTTPWVAPNTMYVISTGTINGVSRTVQAMGKSRHPWGQYAIYAINNGTFNNDPTINGNLGTNGTLTFTNKPIVSGTISFNGSSAHWGGTAPSGYTTTNNANPVNWPTVDQIALSLFPNSGSTAPGGLAYLATHNDNATANPPIVANAINNPPGPITITFHGKPGGANYYLTTLNLTNTNQILAFDNTNGPINIWIGPDGGSSTCTFTGGAQTISAAVDPTKACHMYCATTKGIILTGNGTMNIGLYSYNQVAGVNSGNPFGLVDVTNNNTVNGSIVGYNVDIPGSPIINYTGSYFQTNDVDYYGFANSWQEQNGM